MTPEPHSVFTDPVTQALHERNLEWLRLMKKDPGWALSRLHRLAELEEQYEALSREREAAAQWQYDMGKSWRERALRAEEQFEALRKAAEDHLDVCSRAAGVQSPLRQAFYPASESEER